MDNSSYNRFGLGAFLASVLFCLVFFIYISYVHEGVDLKEVDESAMSPEQSLAEESTAMQTPWVESPELLALGTKSYKANCALCHGDTGKGDAPAGMALVPPARNLVEGKWTKGGSSIELFKTLRDGIEGGSMASFKHIKVAERWGLVQYIRSITQNKVADDAAELEAFAKSAD